MAREHIVVQARQRAQEFCDRFGLRVPIVQAPMAGSSPPALAIAVAEVGGMGATGVLRDSPSRIAEWVERFRAASASAHRARRSDLSPPMGSSARPCWRRVPR